MTTIRGQLICDIADTMDAAQMLNAGRAVPDRDRAWAISILTRRARTTANDAHRRDVLLQLAVDALLWAEQIDERRECMIDSGDGEAA